MLFIMKRFCFTFFVLIVFTAGLKAVGTKTIDVCFSEEQFAFYTNPLGVIEIISKANNVTLESDTTQPGLPFVPINIKVPLGTKPNVVNEKISKRLLLTDVVISTNPVTVPTNAVIEPSTQSVPTYGKKAYPSNAVKFVAASDRNGYTVLRFLVCPFIYDALEKNLYFIDKISINLGLNESTATFANTNGENMYEIIDDTFLEMDNDNECMPMGITPFLPAVTFVPTKYVIITTKELADAFKPLMLWKKTKGLKACITTIEWIKEKFPADDVQASIKYYLYDMYKNSKLKYALLGGDETIVPVRKCYCETSEEGKNLTPTDLYYACFGNDFLWNANKNGVYGELQDNIGMEPSIFVTRTPVRTPSDVKAFVDKVIGYETAPLEKEWNNNILMAGNYLRAYKEKDSKINKYNDSEVQGDYLYKNYIAPYWKGERKRFYNSYNDFGAEYTLNVENFHEQLSKGYTFVEMISHGKPVSWKLDKGLEYFTTNAEKLENKGYTIITTNACETNAFDDYRDWQNNLNDPCLSESFIRSPKSGVVAYLGSSRYGWTGYGYGLGPSMKYEAAFYEKLFSSSLKDKNFGLIAAAAKYSLINSCFNYTKYRWLQLSINPIGDPEMPIFTSTPKNFNMVNVSQSIGNRTISINTGIDSCTICLMSIDDAGLTYYQVQENVSSAEFPTPKCNVKYCITKQGYIPYTNICYTAATTSESKIKQCSPNATGNKLLLSADIADTAQDASITISSMNGIKIKTINLVKGQNSITEDISSCTNGINVVSLLVDGKVVDSSSFVKK